MIRRLGFILLFAPLVLAIHGCGGELPQGAVAQVGQAVVSQQQFSDLEAAYEAAGHVPDKKTQEKGYRTFQQNLAKYLVMLEILRQEAPKYGIAITEEAVQAKVAGVTEMFQGDQERFEAALESEKLTLDQFKESLRQSMLIDEMKAAVTKDVSVTEEEVADYYAEHKKDYIKAEVRTVKHILIDPHQKAAAGEAAIEPSEGDWEQAEAEADKVRSEILNGADFTSEAREKSDDTATSDGGGELGSIVRGQMVPEFEEAVFSLKKGELSRPVRTEYGYHLIQVTDIDPETQVPYDQVKETIRSALLASRKTATWDIWLRDRESTLGVSYRSGYAPAKGTTTSTMIPLGTTSTTADPSETSDTSDTSETTETTEPSDTTTEAGDQ